MTVPAQTSGLLNSTVPNNPSSGDPADAGMPQLPTNPLLEKIEQGIEAKLPTQFRNAYLAIVVSGNHLMFSPKTLPLFMQIVKSPSFIQNMPIKMANLMALISNQSGKNAQGQPNMSMVVAGPAALTLACHALEFYEQTSGTQLNANQIAQILHDVAMTVLQKFGIGPQQIAQAQAAQQKQGQFKDVDKS